MKVNKCHLINERFYLIKKLDEFQGFDANGYLTLGKPLLVSIIYNCINYIAILFTFLSIRFSFDLMLMKIDHILSKH